MAFALLFAGAAEGHPLVEHDPIADLGGLADHHAHAVVNEEAATNAGAGVDLDPGEEARDLRDQTGDERYATAMDGVGDAVQSNGVQAGVEQHLGQVACGRVIAKDRAHIVAQHAQGTGEGHTTTFR